MPGFGKMRAQADLAGALSGLQEQARDIGRALSRIAMQAYVVFCLVSVVGGGLTYPVATKILLDDWRFWRYLALAPRLYFFLWRSAWRIVRGGGYGFMFSTPLFAPPASKPDAALVRLKGGWKHGASGCGDCTGCCDAIGCRWLTGRIRPAWATILLIGAISTAAGFRFQRPSLSTITAPNGKCAAETMAQKKPASGYPKVVTRDGSVTFLNPEYDDFYHAKSGALEEAFGKYALACGVGELAQSRGGLRILDICFGLGYNTAAALEEIRKAAPGAIVRVTGLEKDPLILAEIAALELGPPSYDLVKELAASPDLRLERDSTCLKIVLGDAARTIRSLEGLFDVVFHDPFSPAKQHDLWSEEFFRLVPPLMAPGGVLATYSCAKKVRANLRAAGFVVTDGPRLRRRGPATLAYRPG